MSNIPAERIEPGKAITIKGKLGFSRLGRLIDGKELQDRIKNSRSNYPTTVPHTSVSLYDVEIVPATPGQLTLEEQYVQERFYVSGGGAHAGKTSYGIDNKGAILPPVFAPNGNGAYSQIILENELANDQEVLVVLNTFASKLSAKRGLGLSQVIVLGEPEFYVPGIRANTAALSAAGITIEGGVTRVTAGATTTAPAAGGSVDDQGRQIPADAATDQYGNPIPGGPTQPAEPAQAQIPAQLQAQPAAEVQTDPWQAPAQAAPAPEAKSAREIELEAQLAALQAAKANSGNGDSAFDGQAGISYNG